MPNWCVNILNVTGEEAAVQKFVEDAKCDLGKDNQVLSFQNIVPVPDDILDRPYDPFGRWAQIVLWGTKWDACLAEFEEIDNEWVEYTFDTAWSPPIPFLIRASEKHPSVEFSMKYEEEGMEICGRVTVQGGKGRSGWCRAESVGHGR